MHYPHTFLLTILLDDRNPALFCGRICFIATAEEQTFTGVDELVRLMRAQIEKYGGYQARDSMSAGGDADQGEETV